MIEIDYIINQFSKVKVQKMKPVIRTIIRSAVYQLKYMDSVPGFANVLNEAVKLASKRGFSTLKGFVNGVLRSVSRNLESVAYPSEEDRLAWMEILLQPAPVDPKQWLASYDEETVKRIW